MKIKMNSIRTKIMAGILIVLLISLGTVTTLFSIMSIRSTEELLYELMKEEVGKAKVEELSAVLLAWIGKLQRSNEEKFFELILYMDQGLDNNGIRTFLEENITEESTQLKGEELREYFRDLEKEVRSIDIRSMKHNTGKKIMKAIDRVFKLIYGCTKINKMKRSQDLDREIKRINYGIGLLNISWRRN